LLGILVIGSGFSGLGMAHALRAQGRDDFEIWERADRLGGTWRDNDYPGCACDIVSPVYSFSFAPNPDWTRLYPPQAEILAYLEKVADRFDLRRHFRFGRNLVAAEWDEAAHAWHARAADGSTATARHLVFGTGGLSNGKLPDIPGRDAFAGAMWHSAGWRHDYDLKGKRIAVIGTGASAIQFVPRIAARVAQLDLFQRTPPWVVPKPDRALSDGERTRFRRFPWLQKLQRAWYYWLNETRVPALVRHPDWMVRFERLARDNIAAAIRDPGLRAKLTPTYRLGCKRILISNDYYPALARPNVAVVTEPIARITSTGIVTADGVERAYDAIIFGTGFDIKAGWTGIRVVGEGGRVLSEDWATAPQALHGISVAGYPNFFITMGPNTGLGHNSMVYMIESQIAHIVSAIRLAEARGAAAVAPKPEAQRAWADDVQRRLAGSVWQTGGCDSWYRADGGRNISIWPGQTFTYRKATKHAQPQDYDLLGTRPADQERAA